MKRPAGHAPTRIHVCIPTYRRPEGLRRALQSVAGQRVGEEGVRVAVWVVDNDAAGPAGAVCDALRDGYPWPLHHVVAPERGISHARNRALEAALPGCDYLAFLDDDEIAPPDWLRDLLAARRRHRADVIAAPVHRALPDSAPGWVREARVFQGERHAEGQRLHRAATGNTLIRAGVLRRSGLRFDPRLALSGGEDTLFFRQLARQGARIHWTNSGAVTETVPAARLSRRWVWRRGYCLGNSVTRVHLIDRPLPAAIRFVPAYLAREGLRALALLGARLRGRRRHVWIDLIYCGAIQLGIVSAVLGGRPRHYERTQEE
ncbi:glycosyltransferase [Alkalilimnicola ehrlichii MLHE-1]|uniref:Glycosyl transferase, family 2 n=1 Tax=Alkalilimnicola ehrlichii (strain ATCC BAA-1101 / DSM 17681 / MLHE-1) TaxID=187272 RepID=Q0A645_ALKEH|nr:glycosyltransferase family 2 protein [Alkalilimnicola ehrlichii]ABI57692.1 glycosyl transferase, family 2 [Alkalilimnicola ehrlichii MLHE-1]